jgi:hypothetical protein
VIAVFIALGGTAFAAATVVNIADPTTPAHVARVNASGQLQTSGSTTVTNTVNTELAAPGTFVHSLADLTNQGSCVEVSVPPSGKAMIVRQVRVSVFEDPSPGNGAFVAMYDSAACSPGTEVADASPATIGDTTIPFDPGLGVRANSGLSAFVDGGVGALVYTDGYSVASSQVPTTGVTAIGSMARAHQH